MAPRVTPDIQDEIISGVEEYEFERFGLLTDEIIDGIYTRGDFYYDPYDDLDIIESNNDEWNKMMEISELLKQKYPFLSDFMNKNRINVVSEQEFSENILDESGKVTFYEHDANGIKYYVVDKKGNIKAVPFEKIDRTEDFEVIDNNFNGEKVGDYVDENTMYILKHDYDNYGNEQSPLYVIPYIQ